MPSVTNCQNLHSNMFLLFPDEENKGKKTKNTFTFQYVSIISAHGADDRTVTYIFTFQYVSIISVLFINPNSNITNLHSNMFLLFQPLNSA